jgi:purine-binding chemotaxis protein CheW
MSEEKTSGSFQIVDFTVANEEYGIRIDRVQEIVRMPEITHLPQTESWIKGVINLRGSIIPVLDLREKFGLSGQGVYTERTRVIVINQNDRQIGLIVDTVSQVLEISEDGIEPPPEVVQGLSRDYIEGIARSGDGMIILLRSSAICPETAPIAVE